jgi:hypothetical protein
VIIQVESEVETMVMEAEMEPINMEMEELVQPTDKEEVGVVMEAVQELKVLTV